MSDTVSISAYHDLGSSWKNLLPLGCVSAKITKANLPQKPVPKIAGSPLSRKLVLPDRAQSRFNSLDDPALMAGE